MRNGCTYDSHASQALPLARALGLWIADGHASALSPRTVEDRDEMGRRLTWWLTNVHGVTTDPMLSDVTADTIRGFLAYLLTPNEDGRWGTDRPACRRALSGATAHRYFANLRGFLNFCVREEMLARSPMFRVTAPKLPKGEKEPLTANEVKALLGAAKSSNDPLRDSAILLTLLDTGLRASELCSLDVGDVTGQLDGLPGLSVVGKGNKRRSVYVSAVTWRAICRYLLKVRRDACDDEPLYLSYGGRRMNPTTLAHTVKKLRGAAGITKPCSPHTLRRTFAVSFLRGGGNLFALQRLMGHSDLTILRRYVALAEHDLAAAHRRSSPVAYLRL